MLIVPQIKRRTTCRLNQRWSFTDIGRSETNYISHGYHRYPAKFIPQIVRKLIALYTTPGQIVCDPFGGCGTTLVEAKMMGRQSIGFDINPIAQLITQTKITPIKSSSLVNALETFRQNLKELEHVNLSVKRSPRIHYWFTDVRLQRKWQFLRG